MEKWAYITYSSYINGEDHRPYTCFATINVYLDMFLSMRHSSLLAIFSSTTIIQGNPILKPNIVTGRNRSMHLTMGTVKLTKGYTDSRAVISPGCVIG